MNMTTDEIKAMHSMREVVEGYGFRPNRSGFIRCPFHKGDRTASLKIYKDNFYCFGCEVGGDIFKFVMLMENCDFKTAFHQLGGEYSRKGLSDAAVLRIKQRQTERDKQDQLLQEAKQKYMKTCEAVREKELELDALEPMSNEWCTGENELIKLQAAADTALASLLELQEHKSA